MQHLNHTCVFVMVCRYVVTFSPLMDTKEDPQAIIIWDILTGQKKRGFHCESSAHWPIFKSVHSITDLSPVIVVAFEWTLMSFVYPPRWSHDGKFFARMTPDTLSIYETPVSRFTESLKLYFCELYK